MYIVKIKFYVSKKASDADCTLKHVEMICYVRTLLVFDIAVLKFYRQSIIRL